MIFIFEDQSSELANLCLFFILDLTLADLHRCTEQVHWKTGWTNDCCAQASRQGFWKEEHLQSAYFGQRHVYL